MVVQSQELHQGHVRCGGQAGTSPEPLDPYGIEDEQIDLPGGVGLLFVPHHLGVGPPPPLTALESGHPRQSLPQ